MLFPKEHERTVRELDSCLQKSEIPVPYCDNTDCYQRDIMLKKFLLARHFSSSEALAMISDINAHRASAMTDIQLLPIPKDLIRGYCENSFVLKSFSSACSPTELSKRDRLYNAMRTGFSGTYHKWDRKNRPIWIERTGMFNLSTISQSLTQIIQTGDDKIQALMKIKAYINEVSIKLIDHQRAVNRDPSICQNTVIMDCMGLSTRQINRESIEILRHFLQYDQRFFPEGVHRIYIVNVSLIVHAALKLIKPFLENRVQDKIHILKRGELKQLLREIDEENLPDFLGGKCTCDRGCVPPPSQGFHEGPDRVSLENIVLPAGQCIQKSFVLLKGASIRWEFNIHDNHSILFSATLNGSMVLIPAKKVDQDHCNGAHIYSHTANDECQLTLAFDNSDSWFRSKSLSLRIFYRP